MAVVTLRHRDTAEMIKIDAPDSGPSVEYLRAGWELTEDPFVSDDLLADSSGEAPAAPAPEPSLDLTSDEPAEPADTPPAADDAPADTEGN